VIDREDLQINDVAHGTFRGASGVLCECFSLNGKPLHAAFVSRLSTSEYVAVVAENLEHGRVSVLSRPEIDVASGTANFTLMGLPTAVEVIESEKSQVEFITREAFRGAVRVVREDLYFGL
jgi:hypothetical protein